MNLQIKELNNKEYSEAVSNIYDLPLWANPKLTLCYNHKLNLVVYSGSNLLAVWIVPLIKQGNDLIAKREYRFLPYASPVIFANDNLKVREILSHLFSYLSKKCEAISLPFAPEFYNLAAIQELGGFVELRLTHISKDKLVLINLPSRIRNHINYSSQHTKTIISHKNSGFKFDLAIKGIADEQIKRQTLAKVMLKEKSAISLVAELNNRPIAGLFVAYDKNSAYMLHSWQEEETPRGTMSNLIYEASNWIFENKSSKLFDFEGSVFQRIDYYYSGFNCVVTPYAYIHWARQKEKMFEMVDKSINIPGRLKI